MASRSLLSTAIFGSILIAITFVSASEAIVMGEQDMRIICNESGQQSLPRRMTVTQVVDDSFFASAVEVEVGVAASYLFRFDVNSGKVVATGVLIKADGSEHNLPRVSGRMKDGDADKGKSTDLVFEPGDIIEWQVKLKGLAPLEGFDCWSLAVGLAGSDSPLARAKMISLSSMKRATR